MKTKLRDKVLDFCRKNRICTRCQSRKPSTGYVTCDACLDYKREDKKRARAKHGNIDRKYYLKNRESMIKKSKLYKANRKTDIGNIEKSAKLYDKL